MENFRHKSVGKLVYDPYRGDMKNRTEWWCIIELDREITRYYRYWVQRRYGIELFQPSWDAHISVVRGEMPRTEELRDLWGKYRGERIEFEYGIDPCKGGAENTKHDNAGMFWMVDVVCPRASEIRTELGLRTFYSYHLTIGRTYW